MENQNGEYTSIFGSKLKKVEFSSYKKMKDARDLYKSAGQRLYESDIAIENRFILDNWVGQTLKQPIFDIHYIDIEVHSEEGFPNPEDALHPIVLITVWSTKHQKYYIFALQKKFNTDFLKEKHWVKVFDTEEQLLLSFIQFINKFNPDIVSGWNSQFFDFPYIINRGYRLFGERKTNEISPVKSVRPRMYKDRKTQVEKPYYIIGGLNSIDYLALYKTYHHGERESYKLDFIARVEIDAHKIEYEGSLKELYHNDWQKYVEYNIQDVNLLRQLDNKLQYMNMMIGICYNCRVPFEQFAVTTKVLDGAFISRLIEEKVVLPDVSGHTTSDKYEGAYVKDPDVGVHDWVVSYDATSLYPSIMMMHNISPETKMVKLNDNEAKIIMDILEGKDVGSDSELETDNGETCQEWANKIKEHKYSITTNGVIYRHDIKGIIPRFVEEWFNKRKIHKKLMLEAEAAHNDDETKLQSGLQLNYKILINSVYGYLGTPYSRLYDSDNAIAVTAVGQECLRATINSIDSFFKDKWQDTKIGKKIGANSIPSTVIYGDTDSVFKNSLLKLESGEILEVQELFKYIHNNDKKLYKKHNDSNREFVFPENIKLPYFDEYENKVKYGNVQYIEKHKVKKVMFRIKTKNGKYIEVTEDHSCIVYENGKLIEKKAKDIKKGDKVITLI